MRVPTRAACLVAVVKPEAALPTARVAPGEYASSLPRRPMDLSGVTYEWNGREKSVRDFIRTTETDGVTFVHEGRIVGDWYANGWSSALRHQPWSVTKSFTSTLVGIALDEGRVGSVREPIDAYVKQLRGTAWEGTTIENILQMESGIRWDEENLNLSMNNQVMQWVQMGLDLHTDGALGMTRNEYLMSLPRVEPPGTTFHTTAATRRCWPGCSRPCTTSRSTRSCRGSCGSRPGRTSGRVGPLDPEGDDVHRRLRRAVRLPVVARRDPRRLFRGGVPGQLDHGRAGAMPDRGPALAHAGGRPLSRRRRPARPATYGFEYVDGGGEWNVVFRAVARRLGGCP